MGYSKVNTFKQELLSLQKEGHACDKCHTLGLQKSNLDLISSTVTCSFVHVLTHDCASFLFYLFFLATGQL